jgi:hypothetical protein
VLLLPLQVQFRVVHQQGLMNAAATAAAAVAVVACCHAQAADA